MNGEFSAGSDGLWPDALTIGEDSHAGHRGAAMQHYFYDIHWDGEILADDEGTSHFDDGSALYYGRTVANRIARCGKGEKVTVHIRDGLGRLLSIATPGPCRAFNARQAKIHDIVERDLARQAVMMG